MEAPIFTVELANFDYFRYLTTLDARKLSWLLSNIYLILQYILCLDIKNVSHVVGVVVLQI